MKNVILERLQTAFQPEHLEVIDDSAKHIGHEGAKDGAGHFTVKIKANAFTDLSTIAAHREIYAVLDDLFPAKIHALVIKIIK